jgi:4-amino-4-deoxy-L-arabinose transferase-like glycosyltransferase
MIKSTGYLRLFLFLAGCLLFIPFLGAVHLFDWDEINFAECAREMITTGDYSTAQINYFPFWEKPPLFIWMQVLSMKAFGINEFAARFPNALCGIATLLLVFNAGRKLYDNRFGLLWALAFAGSLLPHFYFKSGIIDPWFNLFIFYGVYRFILYTNEPDRGSLLNRHILWSALFIGLAVLTKGPVALLVFGLCFLVFRLISRKAILSWKHFFLFSIVSLCLGGTWFLILYLQGRQSIITDFLLYQIRLFSTGDADHGGPFYYHWVVLLIGCFPASVLAIRAFGKSDSDTPFQKHFRRWMLILFWVVLLLFSIVKTKIVHYSSLCYFPLTFLAAHTAWKLINGDITWKKWMTVLTLVTGGIIGLLLTSIQFVVMFRKQIIASGVIQDPFASANLMADVHWTGWEFLIGILFLAGVIGCIIWVARRQITYAVLALFLLTLLSTSLSSLVFAPRVEGYSQRAAIEFYESLKDSDCYVNVYGFKSYAQLFYTAKKPAACNNPSFLAHIERVNPGHKKMDAFTLEFYHSDWLAKDSTGKPVYMVAKINNKEEFMKGYPAFKLIGEKNGFVFFRKNP